MSSSKQCLMPPPPSPRVARLFHITRRSFPVCPTPSTVGLGSSMGV
ncbi:hypothetical protein LINPERHAP1_LOCUS39596 [Linum perenne]